MAQDGPKRWTGLGLVALAGLGLSAGLAGCGGGEGGTAGEAGAGASSTVAAGEAAAGEGGGEAGKGAPAVGEAAAGEGGAGGEAGAASAYAAVDPGSADALKTAQLTGFFLIAERVAAEGNTAEAAILVEQGLLEVARPFPDTFGCCAGAELTATYQALATAWTNGQSAEQTRPLVERARASGAKALEAAGGSPTEILRGLAGIASGLYAGVVAPAGVDPIEYQHAQGAALALKQEFARHQATLAAANAGRAGSLGPQIDAVLALFPSVAAPEAPTPTAEMAAALSRVELTLSGIR